MSQSQTFNIEGFVAGIEIEPDEYLLPLLEVVVNAIQSIEDTKKIKDGVISIKVKRGKQLTFEGMEESYSPIEGYEVYDNGVGFIKKHFVAFNDAFTDINKKKGCKGVGRYTVLACFGSVDVDSTFYEKKDWHNRSFNFNVHGVNPDGNKNLNTASKKKLQTVVKLNNYKKNFQKYLVDNRISLNDIATGIIQHCLLYFLESEVPQIRIYNENEQEDSIFLNDIFSEVIKFDSDDKKVNLKDIRQKLTLNFIRNYDIKSHSFHLCANKREVGRKINISTYIPAFAKALTDQNQNKYHLSVYVTGKLLDEKANYHRNKFAIPIKADDKNDFDLISIEELLGGVSESVKSEYSEWIVDAEKDKAERISNYILNPDKPRLAYRHLLSVENVFDDIPSNASDEKLEVELHKKVFHLEQKRKRAFDKAFRKKKFDKDEFSEIIRTVLKEEAAFSQGKLADLMIQRKSVIKLMRKYLKYRAKDEYMLEEDLHNIIFTMGAESDIMPTDYHNLWLLDERLAFHSFTTSDRQLRTNQHINSDSQLEPDLQIYDFPWAFTDNPSHINSLVIFEFKRPGRDMDTYGDKKLDSQVEKYFEKLMESKSKSDEGEYLQIGDNTPKFGYVICDLHPDLIEYNRKFNGFKPTPHGTLFKINSEINQYIEVMSYQTMLDFAEQRHDVFFKALGIEGL